MDEDAGFSIIVSEADTESAPRLDTLIALKIPNCSRKLASSLIQKGLIRVSGFIKKPGYKIRPGDFVEGRIPPAEPSDLSPEPIPLDILFEDPSIIVLNKSAGIVVHPAPGNTSGTLVNALLHHCPDLEGIGGEIRPGIVHRLDKDTSGVLIVAKNHKSLTALSGQFKSRSVTKKYLAIVYGTLAETEGKINLAIGRHPSNRKQMSIHSRKPREAVTLWRVREYFQGVTLLELTLLTGRTHQIRVHCHAIHHPLVGDPVYGARGAARRIRQLGRQGRLVKLAKRQMLHSRQLIFQHPETGVPMTFQAPLPPDMQSLLDGLRQR